MQLGTSADRARTAHRFLIAAGGPLANLALAVAALGVLGASSGAPGQEGDLVSGIGAGVATGFTILAILAGGTVTTAPVFEASVAVYLGVGLATASSGVALGNLLPFPGFDGRQMLEAALSGLAPGLAALLSNLASFCAALILLIALLR